MIEIPVKVVSVANLREPWQARARRAKAQRSTTHLYLRSTEGLPVPTLPCIVRLVRIAPRELDDDNLQSGLKSVRDGVADWIGVDDRDPRVRYEYGQDRGKPRHYGVRVEIQPGLAL